MGALLDLRTTEIDGVSVELQIVKPVVTELKGDRIEVRATVAAAHAGCGALAMRAKAGAYLLALGRQDVLVGHAAFDDRYLVKTGQAAALRYWFTERECEAMLATYVPTAIVPWALRMTPTEVALERTAFVPQAWVLETLEDRRLLAPPLDESATWSPFVDDADVAARAVAMLAGRGRRLADSWRARLAPLGLLEAGPVWRTDEGYAATLAHGRARVRVDFPWRMPPLPTARLRTRLTIEWPHDGIAAVWPRSWLRRERPVLDDAEAAEVPGWEARTAGAEVLRALPTPGPALRAAGVDWLIATPRQLAIGWERIVEEPAALTAGLGLLARWAEHTTVPAAPYR